MFGFALFLVFVSVAIGALLCGHQFIAAAFVFCAFIVGHQQERR